MTRWHVQLVAFGLALAGIIAGALAWLGPHIGLGVAEEFVLYRGLGLTRTGSAIWAAAIIAFAAGLGAITKIQRIGALFANIALTLLALAITLIMLEGIARAIDGVTVPAWRNWLAERNALLTTHVLSDYDPIVGWVIKSHVRSQPGNPADSFTTGPYGIRLNHPDDGPPPNGGILAVGDSFTVGSDVGDRHSWPAQLQSLVGRPVINAAAGGWGTDQIVLRAESLLPVLTPKLVILSFFHADVQRTGYRVWSGANKPYFTIENGALVHHNRPVPRYTGRADETPRWLVVPSHFYLVLFVMDRLGWSEWWQALSTSYVKAENDPAAVTCALLDRFQRLLKSNGIGLLLVIQYGATDMTAWPAHASNVGACARQVGIDSLDLWDELSALHQRSPDDFHRLWVSFGPNLYGHMSSLGNRLVAERIAARLRALPAR